MNSSTHVRAHCAYADWREGHGDQESYTGPSEAPCAGAGEDWMDVAPPTPLEAFVIAGELWGKMEASFGLSVETVYNRCADMDGHLKPPCIADFGHCAAMEALGTGVSWADDHPVPTNWHAKVPSIEYHIWAWHPEWGDPKLGF